MNTYICSNDYISIEHCDEVITAVFQYIEMLRDNGIQPWIFEECRDINDIKFKFSEKSNPASFASRIAGQMQRYRPEHILSGPYLFSSMDAELIRWVLSLLTPSSFRVMIVSSDFVVDETWSEARYYGTPYKYEPLSESLMKVYKTIDCP
jgi:insulysin